MSRSKQVCVGIIAFNLALVLLCPPVYGEDFGSPASATYTSTVSGGSYADIGGWQSSSASSAWPPADNVPKENLLSDTPDENKVNEEVSSDLPAQNINMLIFVSPQYSNDLDISNQIDNYRLAVKNDIGWNTEVIKLAPESNDFNAIDKQIEDYYNDNDLKACIMVGEDIDTALDVASGSEVLPDVSLWTKVNRESDANELLPVDVVVSLIYPSGNLEYTEKAGQIKSVFEKFATDRDSVYPDTMQVLASSLILEDRRENIQKLQEYGDVSVVEEGTPFEIEKTFDETNKAYFVFGHGDPSSMIVSNAMKPDPSILFDTEDLDDINAPVFVSFGCYTGGWFVDRDGQTTVTQLEPSKDTDWFGNNIFTNSNLRVEILGLAGLQGPQYKEARHFLDSPKGDSYPNFIFETMPDLASGKTLAESMLGDSYYKNDFIIYGDPTFHSENTFDFERYFYSNNWNPMVIFYRDLTLGEVNFAVEEVYSSNFKGFMRLSLNKNERLRYFCSLYSTDALSSR